MARRSRRMAAILVVLLMAALIPATTAVGADPSQPTTKADCKKGGWQNYPNAGFRNQGDCIRFVQTGTFTCRDPLGCVTYSEEDPLRLATALAITGPLAPFGVGQFQAVSLALDSRGPLLGHPVELISEDAACSAEGGEAAASAIVANPTIAAVVGTSCSGSALPAAPIISDAGYSMVSPSNTAPSLTDPDTHAAGYLRVVWNGRDEGVAMAEFVSGDGAATSAVVVQSGPPPISTVDVGVAFVETFEGLGGNNLAFEYAEADGSDAAEVIAAVVAAGVPNVLYLPVLEPPASDLVTAARANPALDETRLAAAQSFDVPTFVNDLGDDAEGMLFTVSDTSFTDTPEYAAFATAYFDKYGEEPVAEFDAYSFDAANMILNGIEGVGIVDGDATLHIGRQALRDALFATDGFEGLTGTITCDPFGDCAATDFNILTVVGGELVPAT